MTQLERQVAALTVEPIRDVIQSMAERLTTVEEAIASLSAVATAPDVLQRITNRLTSLEEAIASTALAAGDSVERQDVLQGQTERNTDTLPTSEVGQSSDAVLQSQTEGKTISTTEAQGNTPPTKKSDPGEWLTVKEAFRRLGGNPDNAASVVTSLDGRRKVKFGTFRTLRAQDYKAFGLELSGSRRGAKKPYLRIMAIEFQNKRCQ